MVLVEYDVMIDFTSIIYFWYNIDIIVDVVKKN